MAEDRYGGMRLRLHFDSGVILGPGRIELLQQIAETGSLAAAGRSMKMSYRRAWSIVEALNEGFDTPLVELSRGGSSHGGAALTELGCEVVRRYRAMVAATAAAIDEDFAALRARTCPESGPSR